MSKQEYLKNMIGELPTSLEDEIEIMQRAIYSKNQRIKKLEQENAELKQRLENAVEPKFKDKEWCYTIVWR